MLQPDLNRRFLFVFGFLEKDAQQFACTLTALHWLFTAAGYITLVVFLCDPVAAILVFYTCVTETCPLQG